MARFSINKLPEKERIRLIGEFYDAMGVIKNRDEAAKIFRDILDGNEIGNVMRRIDIAILLLLGFTYDDIVNLLGVGKNKISNVHKKIERGGEGYKILLQRILEKRKQREVHKIKKSRKAQRYAKRPDIESMKKRYPGHFLLWNILDEFGDSLAAHAEIKGGKEEMGEYYDEQKRK